jgi:predicted ATPase
MAPPLNRAVATWSAPDIERFKALLAAALAPFRIGDRLRVPATALCATGAK